jgi:DNA-binding transcriptional ArsR family regulator
MIAYSLLIAQLTIYGMAVMALPPEHGRTGTVAGAPRPGGGRVPPPGGPEPTGPQLRSAAATFSLLASPSRLHLMWLMAHDTLDVAALARRAGLSIPTTSQHLAKLRLAKIAAARREGRHTYYSVEDPHVLAIIGQIFAHIAPDGTLAPDP